MHTPVGVELGRQGVAEIARVSLYAIPGKRRDIAAGLDLAHAVIARVGDNHVAEAIDGQAVGIHKLGSGGRSAVARISRRAGSRKHLQRSVHWQAANLVTGTVGNVKRPGRVERDRLGTLQVIGDVVSGHRRNQTAGPDFAHPVVSEVRNPQVAARIDRYAGGFVERRAGGRSAVAMKGEGDLADDGHQGVIRHEPLQKSAIGFEHVAGWIEGQVGAVAGNRGDVVLTDSAPGDCRCRRPTDRRPDRQSRR